MNNLSMTGRVGRDAVVKFTPKGDAVCTFSAALTSGYGEKAVTTWLNCSLWGKRAETLAPMLLKGTLIGLTGDISLRVYTNKEGQEKSTVDCRVQDVTLLGGKSESREVAKDDVGFDTLESDIPF